MQRHPPFEPPEYLEWSPDPSLVRDYAERLEADPERARHVAELDASALLSFYEDLVRTRLHDIALKRWVRSGVLSKAWLCTGEEAVTVGAVRALDPAVDVLTPMIRNAGALPMMGMALADIFRGYLATAESPNGGRDLHLGNLARGILQPISHVGSSVPVMAGAALAFKLRGEQRVALTWIGDGATRTAACHEGMNLAAVLDLPVVFVIQNNQVALGTRLEQHSKGDPRRWPDAYGIPSWPCDGNNVLDVYAASRLAVERCRSGRGPAAVVAETFRMGGHATHDEREARETFPPELFAEWGRRDPIGLFEAYVGNKGIGPDALSAVEEKVSTEIESAATEALAERDHTPRPEAALYEGVSEGGCLVGLEKRPVG